MRDILAVIGGTLIVIFSISMCNKEKDTKTEVKNIPASSVVKNILHDRVGGWDVNVVIVDSCEYLYCGYGNYQMFTHKGNCRYCKARQNKK